MEFTTSKLNTFLFFKLPAAFWCGVRVQSISTNQCEVFVRHKWINQNPFQSIYFAVQAMAAELSTGVLVMQHIKKSGRTISMLVAKNKSVFTKKATGKITFVCKDDHLIQEALEKTIASGAGQTFWLKSIGVDAAGDQVSEMDFEWTVKLKL